MTAFRKSGALAALLSALCGGAVQAPDEARKAPSETGAASDAFAPTKLSAEPVDEQAVQARVFAGALKTIAGSMARIDTIGGALPVVTQEDPQGRSVSAPLFRQADGPTTGVIWSADGFIISSSINFMREPSVTTVTLHDGRRLVARLVARDRGARLALLKVAARDLQAPQTAPAGSIQPGQWALAAGFGHDTRVPTLAVGVVSGLNRTAGLTLQTDAKISPANYGGPLFDVEGRLLGVCVPMAGSDDSELAGVEWYDSGIGFAVSVEELQRRVERLKQGKDLEAGYFAANLDEATPVETSSARVGVRVIAALPGEEAEALRKDDVVVRVSGRPVPRPLDVKRILAQHFAGDVVELEILREGEQRTMKVRLLTPAELRKRLAALAESQPASGQAEIDLIPTSLPAEPLLPEKPSERD